MFASRELRKTVHRVRNKEVGRGRGPTSGANDVMKILWNVALLVGCKAARLALDVWLPDNADPALAYGLEAAAGFTALRVLFFACRRFLLRLLLRCHPWARQRQQQREPPLSSNDLVLCVRSSATGRAQDSLSLPRREAGAYRGDSTNEQQRQG